MSSLDSPFALATRLGIQLSPTQKVILDRFSQSGHGQMDCSEPAGSVSSSREALALCALWRMMQFQNSRCTVVGSTAGPCRKFMRFLQQITEEIDAGLAHTVRWPRWNVMRMHGRTDYECRYVSTPCSIRELPQKGDPQTILVLEAGSSTVQFAPMMQAVDKVTDFPGCKVARLW